MTSFLFKSYYAAVRPNRCAAVLRVNLHDKENIYGKRIAF